MKHLIVAALAAALTPILGMAQSEEACVSELCVKPQSLPGAVAFIDPETGELLTGERAGAAARDAARSLFIRDMEAQMREAFDTEGLVESRTETGAIVLNLQGKFQSPVIARIRPEGPVVGHMEVLR